MFKKANYGQIGDQIEGIIPPDDHFGLMTRVIVGIISGGIFWSIMLYGLPRKK